MNLGWRSPWFTFASSLHEECPSLLYKSAILGLSTLYSLWFFLFFFSPHHNFTSKVQYCQDLQMPSGQKQVLCLSYVSRLLFFLHFWPGNFLFYQEFNDFNILSIRCWIFIALEECLNDIPHPLPQWTFHFIYIISRSFI